MDDYHTKVEAYLQACLDSHTNEEARWQAYCAKRRAELERALQDERATVLRLKANGGDGDNSLAYPD